MVAYLSVFSFNFGLQMQLMGIRHTSHVTRHSSLVTRHPSFVTRHTIIGFLY